MRTIGDPAHGSVVANLIFASARRCDRAEPKLSLTNAVPFGRYPDAARVLQHANVLPSQAASRGACGTRRYAAAPLPASRACR
ncbi:hypothetical protein WK25_03865 [Burkholderia latens]|nr:hypothetical protein WK25_03865 [Burkholderia latens]